MSTGQSYPSRPDITPHKSYFEQVAKSRFDLDRVRSHMVSTSCRCSTLIHMVNLIEKVGLVNRIFLDDYQEPRQTERGVSFGSCRRMQALADAPSPGHIIQIYVPNLLVLSHELAHAAVDIAHGINIPKHGNRFWEMHKDILMCMVTEKERMHSKQNHLLASAS